MTDTSVTFENAALSEAIKRVSRVAPKSGEAYDKAAGIIIEVNPSWDMVLIKATNLSIYYSEWVVATAISGVGASWRISTEVFTQITSRLPIGSGKQVILSEKDNKLQIKSGAFKASIGLIRAGYYPDWNQFDPEGTEPVEELGSRIEQVAWCAVKGMSQDSLSGIRFNGKTLVATDKYRLVSVPCVAPHIEKDVVIPASILASLISPSGATRIGLSGDQMFIVPNQYTQIRCLVYGGDYPRVEGIMHRDHPQSIKIDRLPFVDAMNRVASADTRNRMPELSMFIGNESIALFMEDSSGGDKTIDQIEYAGQAVHERFRVFITPGSLVDAITASPSDSIELFYDTTNKMKTLRIAGGNGYEAWVMPRSGIRQVQEEE